MVDTEEFRPDQFNRVKVKLGWADELLVDIIPCLQNYIKKGIDVLFLAKDPHFGMTYSGLLFRTIEGMMTRPNIDTVLIYELSIAMLENYHGEINFAVPFILEPAVQNLFAIPDTRMDMKKASAITVTFEMSE